MKDFIITECGPACIDEIVKIQSEVFSELTKPEILRKNSTRMLSECLESPHVTLGAWREGVMAAFSILYYPQDDSENLSLSLENVETEGLRTANNKLCIVRKAFRGNSLQYKLGREIERRAAKSGSKLICATVSPKNEYSIHNMERLGYTYNRTLSKYGLERNLYYKFL